MGKTTRQDITNENYISLTWTDFLEIKLKKNLTNGLFSQQLDYFKPFLKLRGNSISQKRTQTEMKTIFSAEVYNQFS